MASPGFELVSTFWLILHVVARLPGVALSAALAFLASVCWSVHSRRPARLSCSLLLSVWISMIQWSALQNRLVGWFDMGSRCIAYTGPELWASVILLLQVFLPGLGSVELCSGVCHSVVL